MTFKNNMRVLYNRIFFISTIVGLIIVFNLLLFLDFFISSPNSICLFGAYNIKIEENIWHFVKLAYFFFMVSAWICISHSFYTKNKNKFKIDFAEAQTKVSNDDELHLLVGKEIDTNKDVIIPEKGLYQNLLITGTIGTGKTSSAMYPFLDQLLSQNLGMLILDVKGNFHKKVLELNEIYHRKVIVIELNRQI